MVKIVIAGLLFTLPIAMWLLYKPARILAPDFNDTQLKNWLLSCVMSGTYWRINSKQFAETPLLSMRTDHG